jgi:NAD(P)-dependent dehydrogenase (short-subunit alcohol dehydrogenase family)
MTQSKSIPTALISGGGSGIGRATALRFLNEGWQVVIIGRRLEPLQEFAGQSPDRIFPFACDITKIQDVEKLASELRKKSGLADSLNVIVNNAGIFERRSIRDTDDALWMRIFETNLLGSVRLTREFLPEIERNHGAIINVSSTLGLRPVAETSAYSALKAAMINWTQCLALEISPSGARANCVCPGIVDTPIHAFHSQTENEKQGLNSLQPLGRLGRPEDVAHAIWSLSAPGSEWMTGSVLNVDGGIYLS